MAISKNQTLNESNDVTLYCNATGTSPRGQLNQVTGLRFSIQDLYYNLKISVEYKMGFIGARQKTELGNLSLQ